MLALLHAFLTGMQRNLQQMLGNSERWMGARFSRVPEHYPDPEIPGHYMNVFKTPITLNDGQQQPVDDLAPRDNVKRLFKDGAISSGDSE
jgi:hypothetical protein